MKGEGGGARDGLVNRCRDHREGCVYGGWVYVGSVCVCVYVCVCVRGVCVGCVGCDGGLGLMGKS